MDPVSNVDRLVLLLRQRLREREGARSAGRVRSRPSSQVDRAATAQALAALADTDERQLRRALIQGLLSDQFGRQLVNEARFQEVVDRVVGALEEDPDGLALLRRVTTDLREAGDS